MQDVQKRLVHAPGKALIVQAFDLILYIRERAKIIQRFNAEGFLVVSTEIY